MKRREWALRLLPLVPLLLLLLCFPEEMTDGIRQGLSLCGTAVIPSLFPFFVVCTFFVRSGLCDGMGRVLSPVIQKLFRLPGSAAGAILLGLCGGYPVGTRMTAELYRKGSLSQGQAERLCLFCVSAGPAFVVGTVGAGLLHSRGCGWMLFASVTLANLTIGLLLRYTGTGEMGTIQHTAKQSLSRSIAEAVSDAGASMVPLCAWILLFSGVGKVLERLPVQFCLPLCSVLEVTNGCKAASAYGVPIPLLAAILGFGGLSVHCQILPNLTECGVKLSQFFAFRALIGALSAVYCSALFRLFPQAVSTMVTSAGWTVEPFTASVSVSVALLGTAAVFILNTAEPDKTHL